MKKEYKIKYTEAIQLFSMFSVDLKLIEGVEIIEATSFSDAQNKFKKLYPNSNITIKDIEKI